MNKPEAMLILTSIKKHAEAKFESQKMNEAEEKICEALDVAIDALNKQIPKKSNRAYCPTCGEILGVSNYAKKICTCGQRLEFE